MTTAHLNFERTHRLHKLQKAKRRQISAWVLVATAWALFLLYSWYTHAFIPF